MGPPSYMRSVVDRNVVMRSIPVLYRRADKSLARPARKQANVSVRMAWISFGALSCRKKKTWWHLASRCCWNRARPWHASELVSFLVGLKTYQHPRYNEARVNKFQIITLGSRTFQVTTLGPSRLRRVSCDTTNITELNMAASLDARNCR